MTDSKAATTSEPNSSYGTSHTQLLDEQMFKDRLAAELATTAKSVVSHSTTVQAQIDGARQRVLQRAALTRAVALAPTYRQPLLDRARHIQKARASLTNTLHRFARQLVANRDALSTNDGPTTGVGSAKEDMVPNFGRVWRTVTTELRDEPAYFVHPLCPSQESFFLFCKEAFCKRGLHRRLGKAVEHSTTTTSSSSSSGSGSAHQRGAHVKHDGGDAGTHGSHDGGLEEGLELLIKIMGSPTDDTTKTSSFRAQALADAVVEVEEEEKSSSTSSSDGVHVVFDVDAVEEKSSDVAASTEQQNMKSTVPKKMKTREEVGCVPTVRLPCLLSLGQFCCDLPWVVAAGEAAQEAEKRNGKRRKNVGAYEEGATVGFALPLGTAAAGRGEEEPATAAGTSGKRMTTLDGIDGDAKVSSPNGFGDNSDYGNDCVDEDHKAAMARVAMQYMLTAVDTAWADLNVPHMEGMGKSKDDAEEELELMESFVDATRIRYAVELAARVVALDTAMRMLLESEDMIIFNGHRTVYLRPIANNNTLQDIVVAGAHHRNDGNGLLPFTVLSLPGEQQVYYCVAYCLGAAFLRDYVVAAESASSREREEADIEEEETASSSRGRGYNGAARWAAEFERQFLCQPPSSATPLDISVGSAARLWLYMWEYVITVPSLAGKEHCAKLSSAQVPLSEQLARRWLQNNADGFAEVAASRACMLWPQPWSQSANGTCTPLTEAVAALRSEVESLWSAKA